MDDATREREQRRADATAMAALADSAAWRATLAWLASEVTRAEGEAILADASESSKVARRKIITWQERKKVLLGLESRVDDARELLARMNEEDEDERSRERDRGSRAGW